MFFAKLGAWTVLCMFGAIIMWAALGVFSVILWSGGCFGLGVMYGMAEARTK